MVMEASSQGIEAGGGSGNLWRLRRLFGDPIPQAALARFFDQLALLLGSGMLISEAVRRAARSADPELERIMAVVAGPLSAGVPLHRTLAPFQNRLPEIVLPVLEVGEASGTLEAGARRLADAFSHGASIDRRIRYSFFDPRIIIAVLVLDAVGHGFQPTLAGMALQGLSTLLQLACLYLLGRTLVRFLFRWQSLRLTVDTIKLALPHLGMTLRNLAIARWARSFVTLWSSGVPISEALEISSRSALNAHYERAFQQAAVKTRQGQSLTESLAETALLPPYLLDILRTAETSGSLDASLGRFVTVLEEQAMASAAQEFVVILIAGQILLAVAALTATGAAFR